MEADHAVPQQTVYFKNLNERVKQDGTWAEWGGEITKNFKRFLCMYICIYIYMCVCVYEREREMRGVLTQCMYVCACRYEEGVVRYLLPVW